LGEPDEKALLAYEIHLEEGFETDRFVDIFDAGPVLTAQIDRSACVTRNETRAVHEAGAGLRGATYLIASNRAGDFRCALADLPAETKAGAPLPQAVRAALGVQDGDAVRCVPLHQQEEQTDDLSGEAQ
jgi:arginine N-succinyltransferase